VDQFFDRLGTLLRSFVSGEDDGDRPFSGEKPFGDAGRPHSADPFLDDAMEELNAFLGDDREKTERLRAEREARARAEDEARARRAYGSPSGASGPPAKLSQAYATLGLSYGAPFEAVRSSYKKLLKQHHPDRHGSDPVSQKKATETCARINNAYRIIETWKETGSLGDE
jgi:DnaJ-class molecular chaperone